MVAVLAVHFLRGPPVEAFALGQPGFFVVGPEPGVGQVNIYRFKARPVFVKVEKAVSAAKQRRADLHITPAQCVRPGNAVGVVVAVDVKSVGPGQFRELGPDGPAVLNVEPVFGAVVGRAEIGWWPIATR